MKLVGSVFLIIVYRNVHFLFQMPRSALLKMGIKQGLNINMAEMTHCGGTGTDSTVPTNTVQVPITTGTVTDSGLEYTGLIGVISGYIYKTGKL